MKKILGYILLLMASALAGCHSLGDSDYDDGRLIVGGDTIDSLQLCLTFDSLIALDHDTLPADRAMRRFYGDQHRICWLTNDGVTDAADTLMAYIGRVGKIGFEPSQFFCSEISKVRERVDSLDFTEEDVYTTICRMDMLMTKAFLRYAGGQRYGFANPSKLLNHLDQDKRDTTNIYYRQLYDIPTEVIARNGYQHLASMAGTDSVAVVLQEAEPQSELYQRLKARLMNGKGGMENGEYASAGMSEQERCRIMVNMERCRWRHPHTPADYEKYIMVNIPSYELLGVDGDSTLEMRIVCGSRDTKTPLLHSEIMRMDVNPQWMVPASVIKHEMARHAGDSAWFARHRYVITDRKSGDRYNPRHVSREMMERGLVRVAQEGGEGNALGRIIFRFNNNFSIFLHDTSSKGTFDRMDRRASHGCIRVQKPYELACFLLDEKDPELMDKIQYSMTVSPPKATDGDEDDDDSYDPSRIVHSVKVKPQVPLFITYYTMFLMPDGRVHTFPDVYGYDPVIMEKLQPYTRNRTKKSM